MFYMSCKNVQKKKNKRCHGGYPCVKAALGLYTLSSCAICILDVSRQAVNSLSICVRKYATPTEYSSNQPHIKPMLREKFKRTSSTLKRFNIQIQPCSQLPVVNCLLIGFVFRRFSFEEEEKNSTKLCM